LFAFAALNEHGGQAGNTDDEHAQHAELHAGPAFALQLQQGALGDEWIRMVH